MLCRCLATMCKARCLPIRHGVRIWIGTRRMWAYSARVAAAAAGVLTFSLAQAAEAAVTVPADTVCPVAGQPYLQFATTKAATIPAGEWTVDMRRPFFSLGKTTAHNVEPGCITVMVNPPGGHSAG